MLFVRNALASFLKFELSSLSRQTPPTVVEGRVGVRHRIVDVRNSEDGQLHSSAVHQQSGDDEDADVSILFRIPPTQLATADFHLGADVPTRLTDVFQITAPKVVARSRSEVPDDEEH